MTMTPTRQKPTISSGLIVLRFAPVGLAVLGGLVVVGLFLKVGTVEERKKSELLQASSSFILHWSRYSMVLSNFGASLMLCSISHFVPRRA